MKKLLFVFNPCAGKGQIKANLCDIVDIFTKGGYDVVTYPTQAPRDGYNKIVSEGRNYDLICTSGGDGTLSEAVRAVMTFDTKIPLGYIPAGSTNDVAHSLCIPKKMTDCAQEIMNGIYFDYDVGKFNGEYFVYVAAFGAFTDVSYETPQNFKNMFGHAAYVAEGLKRLSKITGNVMTVEHDGETIQGDFVLGLISNTVSIGGIRNLISHGVCFDDGLFEVTLVKTPKNVLELNSIITNAAIKKYPEKNFITFKTSHVEFTGDTEIAWTLDGESGGKHSKVVIDNCKQAIRFKIKPADFTAEQEAINACCIDKDNQVYRTNDGRPVVIEDQSDIEI